MKDKIQISNYQDLVIMAREIDMADLELRFRRNPNKNAQLLSQSLSKLKQTNPCLAEKYTGINQNL